MKKVAIIGTNGIPNRYGGFETLVEYLVKYLAERFEITVFCPSSLYPEKHRKIGNVNFEYIPLNANGWQSIPYDILSILKAYRVHDKLLILGASGTIILPFLFAKRNKFIFNFGGLDWQRSKWGYLTKKYLKLSESMGIKFSDFLISDNKGIQEYILREYKRDSKIITYGGDQVFNVDLNGNDNSKYPFLGEKYAFCVARIQPDNNVEMILEAFLNNPELPIAIVGNWSKSSYGTSLKIKYLGYENIFLLDAIYEPRELNLLRSNCHIYIHGHSAGGTNPALVEAMSLGLPILAFSNVFNKYTTHSLAVYFSTSNELNSHLKNLSDNDLETLRSNMLKVANAEYKWQKIANQYAEIIES